MSVVSLSVDNGWEGNGKGTEGEGKFPLSRVSVVSFKCGQRVDIKRFIGLYITSVKKLIQLYLPISNFPH